MRVRSKDRDTAAPGRAVGPSGRLGMAPESIPVAVVVFLGGIGGGIAFPIIPILGVELGLPALLVGWILSANRVTRLFANPAAGALIDRFGGKWPLTIGLVIEGVATGTYSLALHTSVPGWLLLAGRAIWGLGSAAIIVGAVTIALNASDEENRGRSTAAVRLAVSLGMPAGMLAGGLVAGFVSDDAAFLFATAVTFLAGALAWWTVPKVGGPPRGSASQRERTPLAARLRATAASVLHADPRVQVVWLANMLVFFSIQGTLLATLVLLIHARGISVAGLAEQPMAGALLAVMMLASAGITVYVGRALDRIPSRTGLALPGVVSGAVGFAVLALTASPWLAGCGVVLLGVAMGATSIPLLTLLGDLTPEERRGQVVGYYQFFGDVGGSLGPVLGVELVTRLGFTPTYLGVAALLVLDVPLLVLLWRAERRQGRLSAD
jgi:MFS family permease